MFAGQKEIQAPATAARRHGGRIGGNLLPAAIIGHRPPPGEARRAPGLFRSRTLLRSEIFRFLLRACLPTEGSSERIRGSGSRFSWSGRGVCRHAPDRHRCAGFAVWIC